MRYYILDRSFENALTSESLPWELLNWELVQLEIAHMEIAQLGISSLHVFIPKFKQKIWHLIEIIYTRSKSSGDSSSAQRFGRLFTLNGLKGRWIFGRRRDSDGIDQLESRRPPASKILTQWCCELHDINLMILKENQKRESILASDGPWFVGVLERMMFALAVLSLLVRCQHSVLLGGKVNKQYERT
uniref:Uncharacterized protein n=1 Tax=Romanomermis culicivorax TaxID=13658 RepID=A0A915HK94_ROMCU